MPPEPLVATRSPIRTVRRAYDNRPGSRIFEALEWVSDPRPLEKSLFAMPTSQLDSLIPSAAPVGRRPGEHSCDSAAERRPPRELTEVVPKPMVQIGERPILWHIMKNFAAFGHNEFVLALGYKGHVIKEFFLNYKLLSASITVDLSAGTSQLHDGDACDDWKVHLVETGLTTGTGGRLHQLHRWLRDEPFLLTYGDGVSDVDLTALIATHRRCGSALPSTAVRPPSPSLWRHDVRKRNRHRLRGEAADRRRLDQRMLHGLRTGRLRLHGRRHQQPRTKYSNAWRLTPARGAHA